MQQEHFIPGKDASLEHSIATMQAKLLARGFDIEECSWLNPVDNVWSVHVRNRACHLMFTNGKGATKLAAHASALGEYFERLSCNYFWNHYYLGDAVSNREFAHYPRERWFALPENGTDWPADLLTPELQAFYNPDSNIPAEALIDVNTGKFVGKGNARLEDTITRTNMEAVDEIARQIRLRDLGGIIVLDLIDMDDRRNRHKVSQALQEALSTDRSPTKVLSFNDFGLIIMTRKRVKQSLERTMCAPCDYCEGSGWVKSPTTVCYEILAEARRLSKNVEDVRHTTLRVHPEVAKSLRSTEREVLEEIEAYLGHIDVTSDKSVHQGQFDFAFV